MEFLSLLSAEVFKKVNKKCEEITPQQSNIHLYHFPLMVETKYLYFIKIQTFIKNIKVSNTLKFAINKK